MVTLGNQAIQVSAATLESVYPVFRAILVRQVYLVLAVYQVSVVILEAAFQAIRVAEFLVTLEAELQDFLVTLVFPEPVVIPVLAGFPGLAGIQDIQGFPVSAVSLEVAYLGFLGFQVLADNRELALTSKARLRLLGIYRLQETKLMMLTSFRTMAIFGFGMVLRGMTQGKLLALPVRLD